MDRLIYLYTVVATVLKLFGWLGFENVSWMVVILPFWIVILGPQVIRFTFYLYHKLNK